MKTHQLGTSAARKQRRKEIGASLRDGMSSSTNIHYQKVSLPRKTSNICSNPVFDKLVPFLTSISSYILYIALSLSFSRAAFLLCVAVGSVKLASER